MSPARLESACALLDLETSALTTSPRLMFFLFVVFRFVTETSPRGNVAFFTWNLLNVLVLAFLQLLKLETLDGK